MRRATVLIVCADQDAWQLNSYALTVRGARVLRARNIREAEESYGEKCADILLHDIELSPDQVQRYARLAIYWPVGARERAPQLQPIMTRILRALNAKSGQRRNRRAKIPPQRATIE